MQKFRVEFYKFNVLSVTATNEDVSINDTFLEEHEGDTIKAIIYAENEEKAQQKAERFSNNLKIGMVA